MNIERQKIVYDQKTKQDYEGLVRKGTATNKKLL